MMTEQAVPSPETPARPEPPDAGPASVPGRAWLELIRLPNLFTVPGDPWAGAFFAGVAAGRSPGVRLLLVLAVFSLCAYVFGLILNDWVDRERDRERRPERPLARGAIDPGRAIGVGGILAAAALLIAVLFSLKMLLIALALLAAVMLYDLGLKESTVLGPGLMGACRGLSLLAGAVAAGGPVGPAFLPALALAGYIAILTRLAMTETAPARPGPGAALLPALPPLALVAAAARIGAATSTVVFPWPFLAGLSAAACTAAAAGALMRMQAAAHTESPPAFQAAVAGAIRGLVFWQAAYLFLIPGAAVWGALLVFGGAVARSLSDSFRGS